MDEPIIKEEVIGKVIPITENIEKKSTEMTRTTEMTKSTEVTELPKMTDMRTQDLAKSPDDSSTIQIMDETSNSLSDADVLDITKLQLRVSENSNGLLKILKEFFTFWSFIPDSFKSQKRVLSSWMYRS